MRDIRASVEVRALIGAEELCELHGGRPRARVPSAGQYSKTGRTAQPTSVIVLAHRAFRVVKLAHAGCTDSQIREVGAAEEGGARELMPCPLAFAWHLTT